MPFTKPGRTLLQRAWSGFFSFYAITLVLIAVQRPELFANCGQIFRIFIGGIALSRICEIVHGFYKDAFDKLRGKASTTNISSTERLHWLGLSYIENVENFALLYYLDQTFWEPGAFKAALLGMGDAVYFSIMTVTTTGYGDIAPVSPGAKMLCSFEAVSGVLLLVLVLAAYLSNVANTQPPPR